MDDKGNEITFQLHAEQDVFTNAHTILFDEPSNFNYQALEKSKFFLFEYDALMQITSKNSDLLEMNRKFIGKRLIQRVFQRLESLVFLSPEERYERFLNDHAKLIHRVPDKYIANVLGITPVSLSRIRHRIAEKK